MCTWRASTLILALTTVVCTISIFLNEHYMYSKYLSYLFSQGYHSYQLAYVVLMTVALFSYGIAGENRVLSLDHALVISGAITVMGLLAGFVLGLSTLYVSIRLHL